MPALPARAIPSPSSEPDPDRMSGSQVRPAPADAEPGPPEGSNLSADVEAALARLFGRGPGRAATAGRHPEEAGDR
ncbi:hypothetical protein BCD49_20270 [Pseudofrankia sp. EUN1h]|nr:hypothetical protein BCD49_20270 [Pseudofrankia sp. EUN1h]